MVFSGDVGKLPRDRAQRNYFVPSEIGFLVRNNNPNAPAQRISDEDTLGTIQTALDEYDKGFNSTLNPDIPPRVTSLPGFSVAFKQVNTKVVQTDIDLLELIQKLNAAFYDAQGEIKTKTVPPNGKPYQVLAALPNWFSGAQQGRPTGTGGPGGLPVQAQAVQPLTFTGDTPSAILSKLGIPATQKGSSTEIPDHINIYILDTVPNKDGINTKCSRYGSSAEAGELVQLLFGNCADFDDSQPNELHWGDRFSIYYDPTLDPNFSDNFVPSHHYDMRDHGLFIASLIAQQYPVFYANMIQGQNPPPLKIHLIQVLSNYGVGSTDSMLKGLAKALEIQNRPENMKSPSLVNCSWVLSAPCHMAHLVNPFDDNLVLSPLESHLMGHLNVAKGSVAVGVTHIIDFIEYLRGLRALHEQFALLRDTTQALLFACAGNDGHWGHARANARLPAAYTEVIGVTALSEPHGQKTSSYANIADEPSNVGYAIWGGENDQNGVTVGTDTVYFTDPGNSPVGLYFNDAFPNELGEENAGAGNPHGGSNTTGLAHWAGTSFATPLVAATFAASLALKWTNSPADFDTVETAIRSTTAPATADNETTIPL